MDVRFARLIINNTAELDEIVHSGAVESSARTVLFVLLISSSVLLLVVPTPARAQYAAHAPIRITSDPSDFNSNNGVVSGSGTFQSPFVIEGLEITANTTAGILISNTRSFFIIRNVQIHPISFTQGSSGIILENVANGVIENANIANFEFGISVSGYQDRIAHSSSWNDTYGVSMTGYSNTISDNQLYNNTKYGVWLTGSSLNTLTGNNASNNGNGVCEAVVNPCDGEGFVVTGSSNNLFENNTASGNSYFGFRIVLDSNNNVLTNNTISQDQFGLTIAQSSGNQILHNIVANNSYGIGLENIGPLGESNNNVTLNQIKNNTYGIYMLNSTQNTFSSNMITGNGSGIYVVLNSAQNRIYNNYLNNTSNAFDDSTLDAWNTTKSLGTNILGGPFLGGNFYSSAYQGTDPDGDGIGDTPYKVPGSQAMDLLPLVQKQPPGGLVHDVAVRSITAQPVTARAGVAIDVTVAVFNQGTVSESFDVSVSYNQTIFTTKSITDIPAWSGITFSVSWNTADFATGAYVLRANASIVSGETYTANNVSPPITVMLTANQPPIAIFSLSSTSVPAGKTITLDASASHDPDGSVAAYSWDFGDGTPKGTGVTVSHTYSTIGTYTVTLAVTDNEGAVSQPMSKSVVVTSNQPTAPISLQISAAKGKATLTWSPPSGNGGSPITQYRIYRGTSSSQLVLISTVGNVTSYEDETISSGQTYYYQVTALNSAGKESTPAQNSVLVPNSASNLPNGPTNWLLVGVVVVAVIAVGSVTGIFIARRRTKTKAAVA